jgi:hypothetical protein
MSFFDLGVTIKDIEAVEFSYQMSEYHVFEKIPTPRNMIRTNKQAVFGYD